jgi:two-component system chemotaxis response regulator CheY
MQRMSANVYFDAVVGVEIFVDPQVRLHPSVRTVLVVDDQATLRTILAKMLRSLGVTTIVEAGSASDAFKRLHEAPVDLLLSDVEMGDTSGMKLLQAVRKTKALAQLPVIMVTGSKSGNHAAQALSLGADGFMLKPFDAAQLRAKINEAIVKRQRG